MDEDVILIDDAILPHSTIPHPPSGFCGSYSDWIKEVEIDHAYRNIINKVFDKNISDIDKEETKPIVCYNNGFRSADMHKCSTPIEIEEKECNNKPRKVSKTFIECGAIIMAIILCVILTNVPLGNDGIDTGLLILLCIALVIMLGIIMKGMIEE